MKFFKMANYYKVESLRFLLIPYTESVLQFHQKLVTNEFIKSRVELKPNQWLSRFRRKNNYLSICQNCHQKGRVKII